MTVQELIALLKECDQNALVLCDLADEHDWVPLDKVKAFDGIELRWPQGGHPEHYLRKEDIFSKQWHATSRKMVYLHA